jgi:hypothetical protein
MTFRQNLTGLVGPLRTIQSSMTGMRLAAPAGAALALTCLASLDGTSAFHISMLGAPGHLSPHGRAAAFGAKRGLSLRPNARRTALGGLRAVIDPTSVHHAADLLQQDLSVAVQYLADASAAAMDAVDPSKLSSGVEGTGLQKPMELPFTDIPFPKVLSSPVSSIGLRTCIVGRAVVGASSGFVLTRCGWRSFLPCRSSPILTSGASGWH